jgi:nicotinamide phosphoribosyltransferase
MIENIIMLSDSYKYSHSMGQYPENTVGMYDYAEARSVKLYDRTVFFGLQFLMIKYLSNAITMDMVDEASEYATAHGIPFNREGWEYIVTNLGGRLPIRIRAIAEGTILPNKLPLFTIESTDEKVFWVASWVEALLMKVWYPCNIATRSLYVKELLESYAEKTQDNPFIDYSYHNFGDRGSSSVESAAFGAMGQLIPFRGTDNFNTLRYIKNFYGINDINTIAHSIPATEHSTVTSWGREKEYEMMMNHLDNNKGAPLIACVMDSYDYFKAVNEVTSNTEFTSKINSDEYPIFVLRPDSGDPKEIIPKTLDIMEANDVPFTTNGKGFKVFNKYRIIWGDGITMDSMKDMLDIMVARGYSTENISFGSGGWLMQQHDRDTLGFAVKCSNITLVDEVPYDTGIDIQLEREYSDRDVFKDPITAPGKKSKKGKVTTAVNRNGAYRCVQLSELESGEYTDIMSTVYENGVVTKQYTFDEVRENFNK